MYNNNSSNSNSADAEEEEEGVEASMIGEGSLSSLSEEGIWDSHGPQNQLLLAESSPLTVPVPPQNYSDDDHHMASGSSTTTSCRRRRQASSIHHSDREEPAGLSRRTNFSKSKSLSSFFSNKSKTGFHNNNKRTNLLTKSLSLSSILSGSRKRKSIRRLHKESSLPSSSSAFHNNITNASSRNGGDDDNNSRRRQQQEDQQQQQQQAELLSSSANNNDSNNNNNNKPAAGLRRTITRGASTFLFGAKRVIEVPTRDIILAELQQAIDNAQWQEVFKLACDMAREVALHQQQSAGSPSSMMNHDPSSSSNSSQSDDDDDDDYHHYRGGSGSRGGKNRRRHLLSPEDAERAAILDRCLEDGNWITLAARAAIFVALAAKQQKNPFPSGGTFASFVGPIHFIDEEEEDFSTL